MRFAAGPNNTDDAMRVNDQNGIMMPNGQGLNRSNSQNNLPEISNQNSNDQYNELGHE